MNEVLIIFLYFTLILTPQHGNVRVIECEDHTVRIEHTFYPPQTWPYRSVERYEDRVAFEVEEDAIFASGFESCQVIMQPEFDR